MEKTLSFSPTYLLSHQLQWHCPSQSSIHPFLANQDVREYPHAQYVLQLCFFVKKKKERVFMNKCNKYVRLKTVYI